MINHIEIDGIIFPATYINGMLIIDYPNYDPTLAQKITEEGRKNMKKLSEMTSKLIKENNIKFVYNEKDY